MGSEFRRNRELHGPRVSLGQVLVLTEHLSKIATNAVVDSEPKQRRPLQMPGVWEAVAWRIHGPSWRIGSPAGRRKTPRPNQPPSRSNSAPVKNRVFFFSIAPALQATAVDCPVLAIKLLQRAMIGEGKVAVMIRKADIRTELVSILGNSVLPGGSQRRRPAETRPGRLFALIFDDQVRMQRRAPMPQSPEFKAPHVRERG